MNYPCVSPGSSDDEGETRTPTRRWIRVGMWLLCSFQGPPRGAPEGIPRRAVSQNSTACTGSSSTMCGATRRRGGISKKGDPAGPARFGRRTRPYGRRTSHRFPPRVLESTGGRPAMSPCRRGPIKGLPRKEVIQPQLPLRLPCYDFTPVTSPTFDGSLPCGLGHRLRVLLTPVV